MKSYIITIECPYCNETIRQEVSDFREGDVIEVDVSTFEQTTWDCDECGKTFLIGDIDVLNEDDV